MIPQRKRPAQRAYTGLVGRYEPEAAPAGPPSPVPQHFLVQQTTQEILDRLTSEKREKEAQRGRDRRKIKREQLAAIKTALKTPVAEVKRRAEESARKERKDAAAFSMNRASHRHVYMDAEQVGIDRTFVLRAGANTLEETMDTLLPKSSLDPERMPVNDRRVIRPEGAGANEDEDDANDAMKHFKVKQGTNLEREQALLNLFESVFVEVEPSSEDAGHYICRLCDATPFSERTCKNHLESAHGSDTEVEHDSRFGNIISQEMKANKNRRVLVTRAVKAAKKNAKGEVDALSD